jgi:hypothetical protein
MSKIKDAIERGKNTTAPLDLSPLDEAEEDRKLLATALDTMRTRFADVGNLLGGPVGAMSEEFRSMERAERIERASKIIIRSLLETA